MNKMIKKLTAGLLLLSFMLVAAACNVKTKGDATTVPGSSGQMEGATQGSAAPETQGTTVQTDPTEEGAVGSGRPTISYDTEVESGRNEETGTATEPGTQTPTQPSGGTTGSTDALENMNYQKYMNLSADQQQAFFDRYFSTDPLAFATWFQKIKQEYEDEIPEIIATGPVDLEDYINP